MSLLGIDVGTTGCKVIAFSLQGDALATAYREYDIHMPEPGWAELDALTVWNHVQACIRDVAGQVTHDPVEALSVASMGEAVVPVSAERQILGPSLLNFDCRGEAYLDALGESMPDERLYTINGNTLGNHYTLPKLLWLRDHRPALFERTHQFLPWSSFVATMLGAEPAVDYSLANRTLLFDLDRQNWSAELLRWAGLDANKLPPAVPSGQVIGTVTPTIARDLGLPPGTPIVSGAHDQCANAVGCGVIAPGRAVYGMGTYLCITPVFSERRPSSIMIERGLNTEHHAVPGRFVSFLYNQGGSIVKWFRNTFAHAEHQQAIEAGANIYPALFAEMPPEPSSILVLPHFTATGPPEFVTDSCGVFVGLRLGTSRGDILKGIIEGMTFYLKEAVDALPPTGITIDDYRVVGGGSQSDTWVQVSADIMGVPFTRPAIIEAGALGAAIIAGVGCGAFSSFDEGVAAMVRPGQVFEPNPAQTRRYASRFEHYRQLWPLLRNFLREFTAARSDSM